MNVIARQPDRGIQGRDTPVLDSAESALSCGPDGAVIVGAEVVDDARAETAVSRVPPLDAVIVVVDHAPIEEPEPQPATSAIRDRRGRITRHAELVPATRLDDTIAADARQLATRRHPDVTLRVFNHEQHEDIDIVHHGHKAIAVEISSSAAIRDPDAAGPILEQRLTAFRKSGCDDLSAAGAWRPVLFAVDR